MASHSTLQGVGDDHEVCFLIHSKRYLSGIVILLTTILIASSSVSSASFLPGSKLVLVQEIVKLLRIACFICDARSLCLNLRIGADLGGSG